MLWRRVRQSIFGHLNHLDNHIYFIKLFTTSLLFEEEKLAEDLSPIFYYFFFWSPSIVIEIFLHEIKICIITWHLD